MHTACFSSSRFYGATTERDDKIVQQLRTMAYLQRQNDLRFSTELVDSRDTVGMSTELEAALEEEELETSVLSELECLQSIARSMFAMTMKMTRLEKILSSASLPCVVTVGFSSESHGSID